MLLLTCSLTAIAIVIFPFYAHWLRYLRGFKGINGPNLYPVFGNALLFRNTDEAIKVIHKALVEYNDTVRFCIGPIVSVFTTEYKFLEFFLSSTEHINKFLPYNFLKNWLGDGLLTANGQKWKKHRKMITPSYHFKILEKFVDVFERNGDIFLKKLSDHAGKSAMDLYPIVTLFTLDVICGEENSFKLRNELKSNVLESAMGTKINRHGGVKSNYIQCVQDMCKILIKISSSVLHTSDLLYKFTPEYRKERICLKVIHDYTLNVIQQRRKILTDTKEDSVDDGTNIRKKIAFLDLLLKSTLDGQLLEDADILEEVDTFMFAGHDTTASAISFALYCLAEHPEVQQKVLEEQKQIFGEALDPSVTHHDLQEMKYLDIVLKEVLRLYPPVPLIARMMTSDCKFNDDVIFKRGTHIVIDIYHTHRNPKYFPNPEKFNPERFLEENMLKGLVYSYIPFSAGTRNCIGQKFALLEMKSTISKVVRKFKLSPAVPRHELQLVFETTLKSTNGVLIKINKRVNE